MADKLKSSPLDASSRCLVLWQKLRPMTIEMLEKFWRKIEPKLELWDVDCRYEEWLHGSSRFFGMRNKETGRAHGVVREIRSNGFIAECTYKDGKTHGLLRLT